MAERELEARRRGLAAGRCAAWGGRRPRRCRQRRVQLAAGDARAAAAGPLRAPRARAPPARAPLAGLADDERAGHVGPAARSPRRAARGRSGSAGSRAAGPRRARGRRPARPTRPSRRAAPGAPRSAQASRSAARTASAVSGSPSSTSRSPSGYGRAQQRGRAAMPGLAPPLRAADAGQLGRRSSPVGEGERCGVGRRAGRRRRAAGRPRPTGQLGSARSPRASPCAAGAGRELSII